MLSLTNYPFSSGVPYTGFSEKSFLDFPEQIPTFNEGDAVALAAGSWLGGKNTFLFMQSAGIGNCINPLTTLLLPAGIPCFIYVSARGQSHDVAHHKWDPRLVKSLGLLEGIAVHDLKESKVQEKLMQASWSPQTPVNFFLENSPLEVSELKKNSNPFSPDEKNKGRKISFLEKSPVLLSRRKAFEQLLSYTSENEFIVSSTGYLSRELCYLRDSRATFYSQGSMGCASLIGLGLQKASAKKVIILDGDGAILMRLQSMASIGLNTESEIWHFIIDNDCYESTGGQPSFSHRFSFSELALSCGYSLGLEIHQFSKEIYQLLLESPGPKLIHWKVKSEDSSLPPPRIPFDLAFNAQRLRELTNQS